MVQEKISDPIWYKSLDQKKMVQEQEIDKEHEPHYKPQNYNICMCWTTYIDESSNS